MTKSTRQEKLTFGSAPPPSPVAPKIQPRDPNRREAARTYGLRDAAFILEILRKLPYTMGRAEQIQRAERACAGLAQQLRILREEETGSIVLPDATDYAGQR